MAANLVGPTWVLTPNVSISNSASAVTTIDGTGTLVTGFTAGTNGSRVERIRVKCAATSAAGLVNIFIFDGTNNRLLTSITVTAVTTSTTVSAFESVVTLGIVLPTGFLLKWATTIAQSTNVIMEGGDF